MNNSNFVDINIDELYNTCGGGFFAVVSDVCTCAVATITAVGGATVIAAAAAPLAVVGGVAAIAGGTIAYVNGVMNLSQDTYDYVVNY